MLRTDEPEAARSPYRPPHGLARVAVGLGVVTKLLVLLASSYWTGIGHAHLGTAFVTGGGASITLAPSLPWAGMAGLTAAGLLLITRPSRWIESVHVAALFGAGWTLGWTVLFSWVFYGLQFWDPDRRCQYPSCWPGAYQPLAVAAPLTVACLLVIVMATAGRHRHWPTRALVPAGTYLVLTLIQAATWERFLLPLFNAPPPF